MGGRCRPLRLWELGGICDGQSEGFRKSFSRSCEEPPGRHSEFTETQTPPGFTTQKSCISREMRPHVGRNSYPPDGCGLPKTCVGPMLLGTSGRLPFAIFPLCFISDSSANLPDCSVDFGVGNGRIEPGFVVSSLPGPSGGAGASGCLRIPVPGGTFP